MIVKRADLVLTSAPLKLHLPGTFAPHGDNPCIVHQLHSRPGPTWSNKVQSPSSRHTPRVWGFLLFRVDRGTWQPRCRRCAAPEPAHHRPRLPRTQPATAEAFLSLPQVATPRATLRDTRQQTYQTHRSAEVHVAFGAKTTNPPLALGDGAFTLADAAGACSARRAQRFPNTARPTGGTAPHVRKNHRAVDRFSALRVIAASVLRTTSRTVSNPWRSMSAS